MNENNIMEKGIAGNTTNAVTAAMIRILKSPAATVLYFLALTAFYLPYEFEIIPEVITYLHFAKIVCGALVLIAFLLLYGSRLRVFRDNIYLWGVVVFLAVLIYATAASSYGNMSVVLNNKGLNAVFFVMTIAVFFRATPKRCLLIAFFWFLFINLLNVFCIYTLWGVGLWETWPSGTSLFEVIRATFSNDGSWWSLGGVRSEAIMIVGNYNGAPEFVIPMAVCGSAYAHRYGKWLDFVNYPAMAIALWGAYKCGSTTQLAVFAALILLMLIGNLNMISDKVAKIISRIFNPILMVAVNIVAFVGIIWLNILPKLGIDTSFHNRTQIWEVAKQRISEMPVWGHGVEIDSVKYGNLPYELNGTMTAAKHCHSWFLEATYLTGIIGTVVVFALLVIVIIQWFRVKHYRTAYIMSAMTFCLCFTNLFEFYTIPFFLVTLGLIYYIGMIDGGGLPEQPKRIREAEHIRETEQRHENLRIRDVIKKRNIERRNRVQQMDVYDSYDRQDAENADYSGQYDDDMDVISGDGVYESESAETDDLDFSGYGMEKVELTGSFDDAKEDR